MADTPSPPPQHPSNGLSWRPSQRHPRDDALNSKGTGGPEPTAGQEDQALPATGDRDGMRDGDGGGKGSQVDTVVTDEGEGAEEAEARGTTKVRGEGEVMHTAAAEVEAEEEEEEQEQEEEVTWGQRTIPALKTSTNRTSRNRGHT